MPPYTESLYSQSWNECQCYSAEGPKSVASKVIAGNKNNVWNKGGPKLKIHYIKKIMLNWKNIYFSRNPSNLLENIQSKKHHRSEMKLPQIAIIVHSNLSRCKQRSRLAFGEWNHVWNLMKVEINHKSKSKK